MKSFRKRLLVGIGIIVTSILAIIVIRNNYSSCQPNREDRLLTIYSVLGHGNQEFRDFIIRSLLGYPPWGYQLADLSGCRVELTSLPMDGPPVWSPTGKWVAFSSYKGQEKDVSKRDEWSIHVLNIDTMSYQEYSLPKMYNPNHLAWSTDERYMLFRYFDGLESDVIGQLDRQTKQFEQLSYLPEKGYFGAWSPDRDTLVISIRRSESCRDLYLHRTDGTAKRLLYKDETCQYPDFLGWSPDGQVIAFDLSSESGLSDKLCWVWITDGTTECITLGFVRTGTWSPDSQQLIFSSLDGLKVFDMETKEVKTLLEYENPLLVEDIDWSSDGEYIAYALCDEKTIECTVHYLRVSDGKHWRLTNYFVDDIDPMWAPVSN